MKKCRKFSSCEVSPFQFANCEILKEIIFGDYSLLVEGWGRRMVSISALPPQISEFIHTHTSRIAFVAGVVCCREVSPIMAYAPQLQLLLVLFSLLFAIVSSFFDTLACESWLRHMYMYSTYFAFGA